MVLPTYSMMQAPLGISSTAKRPSPALDRLTAVFHPPGSNFAFLFFVLLIKMI